MTAEAGGMAKKKRKLQRFSAVKAVKANARDRVGQPKPERVIEDRAEKKPARKRKHRETLGDLLNRG